MATILIADDERVLRQSMGKLLAGEGYSVDGARNGEEAVELFSRNGYDLVILDIDMPKKDGYAACNEIRSLNRQVPSGRFPSRPFPDTRQSRGFPEET